MKWVFKLVPCTAMKKPIPAFLAFQTLRFSLKLGEGG